MAPQKLLAQGAEAIISRKNQIVVKDRIAKGYRLPELDRKIRIRRTKSEAKLLEKSSKYANVPKVIKQHATALEIEFIPGEKLSSKLNKLKEKEQLSIMRTIGKQIATLHRHDIVHGDLTTSNMILHPSERIYIIDFGLGFISKRVEDKAVDLHLLKEALKAKHYQNNEKLFEAFLAGYEHPQSAAILERLKKVESRGRYKHGI